MDLHDLEREREHVRRLIEDARELLSAIDDTLALTAQLVAASQAAMEQSQEAIAHARPWWELVKRPAEGKPNP